MRKPKIKFNQIKPNSNAAKVLVSIGRFGDTSRVYSKNKKSISTNISRLVEREFITIQKDDPRPFVLTKGGLIEFLKLELVQTDLLPKGKECMVVFDIQEKKRDLRDVLTIFLEESCFIRLQKSVWISPFDAAEKLAEIFKLLEIEKMVKVYTVEEAIPHNNVDPRYHEEISF